MDKKSLALLSVTDKTGIVELASGLRGLEWEIMSTGGTAKALMAANLPVIEVSEYTGVPESPDDKVKTLNHKIHGGLLQFFDDPRHLEWLAQQGIRRIDLVACNLYPFERTMQEFIAKGGDISSPEAYELAKSKMDIGGPTMIRAAAKSPHAAILTSPSQYVPILNELRQSGAISPQTREGLFLAAMELTASYDAMILEFLQRRAKQVFPPTTVKVFDFIRGPNTTPGIRYGENPHQEGALYRERSLIRLGGLPSARVHLEGKELSFNNIGDLDAAVKAARGFYDILSCEFGCATIKHGNNCGFATGATLEAAIEHSFLGDPVSAFGGLLAIKGTVDEKTARKIIDIFYQGAGFIEAIVATGYTPEALALLEKKKNLRVLEMDSFVDAAQQDLQWRIIDGGALAQTKDNILYNEVNFKVITSGGEKSQVILGTEHLPLNEKALIDFGIACVKSLWSNAIVIAEEYVPAGYYRQLGAGMGNPNRLLSTQEAIEQARANLRHEFYRTQNVSYLTESADLERFINERMAKCCLVSEALIPMPDNVEVAGRAGIKLFVQTGGSMRDDLVTEAAMKYGMRMVHTGTRHFRHA